MISQHDSKEQKMSLLSLISLCVAIFILAITPGPGVFATISRSMASGFASSLPLIFGCVTGDVVFLMFAIWGLALIAQTIGQLFVVVKICGGLYLVWLGVRIWRSSPDSSQDKRLKHAGSFTGNYISGLLITLSNPKVIIFYCGFLPTFLDLPSLGATDIILVVAAIAVVLSSVLIGYAYVAGQARVMFTKEKYIKRLNRTAGSVMMATGAMIAVKS